MAAITEPLILASASPRRTELLRAVGIPHEVRPALEAEPPVRDLAASAHVRLCAFAKAREVAERHPGRLVLGADTVVSVGDLPHDILGKPRDAEDARAMLRRLAGRQHDVVSAVVLMRAMSRPAEACREAVTRVTFAPLGPALIERLVASGEPLDKAGAYAVQGRMATHVEQLQGSWSNVVGLPLEVLPALFQDVDEVMEAWQDW
jgi:septum formation protein